jgi:hypothetical protein
MPTPNYSNLAAASAKKSLTNEQAKKAAAPTPVIKPKPAAPTPTITGNTGSQLAAASAKGALTNQQSGKVIAASQPRPPTTTTPSTGFTGLAGSQLAAAAVNGALTNDQVAGVLNPPGKTRYDFAGDAADNQPDSPLTDFREGERNPTTGAGDDKNPDTVFDYAEGDSSGFKNPFDDTAYGGQRWWNEKGTAPDASGWTPWAGEKREDAAADRWQGLADTFPTTEGTPKDSGILTDANGNPPIARTPEQRQVTDAARWTGQAVSQGQWPNIMTERVADELNWRGLGYASAAEWMADMGYIPDPNNPGLWIRTDPGAPEIVNASGGSGAGDGGVGYEYDYGDYGWGDYGYGGYGYGGGYDNNAGYGQGGGLIQWRIGA